MANTARSGPIGLAVAAHALAWLLAGSEPTWAGDLTHGPLIGGVTDQSAVVWVRTRAPAAGQVWAAAGAETVGAAFTTGNAEDRTARVVLTGLSPETEYQVSVEVNGDPQAETVRFRTFPPPGVVRPFTFVVVGDVIGPRDEPGPGTVFTLAAQEQPAFVLLGGDVDHSNPARLKDKRLMFQRLYDRALMPELVALLQAAPIAHVWDDHDYGKNNSNRFYRYRAEALQAFREYVPAYPRPGMGVWQQFTFGHAEFFLLDSRSQRDPSGQADGPGKSMLDGERLGPSGQLAWLLDGLLASSARWKFVYTPVPFNPTVPKEDAWAGFLYERQVILDAVQGAGVQGVILLSGDLHAGAIDDGQRAGWPELMAPAANISLLSPVSCLSAPVIGQWSVGTYYGGQVCNGYGVVRVEAHRVLLEVRDDTGAARIVWTVE